MVASKVLNPPAAVAASTVGDLRKLLTKPPARSGVKKYALQTELRIKQNYEWASQGAGRRVGKCVMTGYFQFSAAALTGNCVMKILRMARAISRCSCWVLLSVRTSR